MTKKWMAVLALGLLAPAAFGQAVTTPTEQTAAPVKTLNDEIKGDKAEMVHKTKASRADRKALLAEQKAALARVTKSSGTRAEKKQARKAVRAKYAALLKDARATGAYHRKNLNEDILSKRAQIKKLRQS